LVEAWKGTQADRASVSVEKTLDVFGVRELSRRQCAAYGSRRNGWERILGQVIWYALRHEIRSTPRGPALL